MQGHHHGVERAREDAKVWIIKNQIGRRNLQSGQRAMLVLQMEDLVEELERKAAENQGLSEGRGNKKGFQNSENPLEEVNTTKSLAEIAGISIDTLSRAKKINAEGDDELKKKLLNGEISVNKGYETLKERKKREKEAVLKEEAGAPGEVESLSLADIVPVEEGVGSLGEEEVYSPGGNKPVDSPSETGVAIVPENNPSLPDKRVVKYKAAYEAYQHAIHIVRLNDFKGVGRKAILEDIKELETITRAKLNTYNLTAIVAGWND
ncbi:MAG: hypothetical protein JRC86_13490 [Deltaproteobacteria bacterium]|nr:hypothetical protein [Deltaproteobacteria bacterium]